VHLSAAQIREAIDEPHWQEIRLSMKGIPTDNKLGRCRLWLTDKCTTVPIEQREIQVMNYLNALARGGQIEPVDKSLPLIEACETAIIRR
jgi:hypothetical protein